jgi:hypothetical protein
MKCWVSVLLLLWSTVLSAEMRYPTKRTVLEGEAQMQEFLMASLPELQGLHKVSLEPVYANQSRYSKHVRFQLQWYHIPVFNQYVTLHLNKANELLSYQTEFAFLGELQQYHPKQDFDRWSAVHPEKIVQENAEFFSHLKQSQLEIYPKEESTELMLVAKAWSKTYDRTLVYQAGGNLELEINHERSYTDTTVQVKVFNPDPLTTLGKNYGGVYIDSGDAHQPWCDTALQQHGVRATFSNGVFYLENELVTLDEFEPPVFDPVTETMPQFFYTRNQSGFEDANIVFHITTFHDYIASLGYDTLMSGGVLVDAHAQNGADNSVFTRNGGNPTLRFGTGGVDDGEDADVIVHEYAHGLSWSANGNDNFSVPRQGLDEGVADYWATSYSRMVNPFQWENVFSWDGHNTFWGGRTATTSNNYPQPSGLIYYTGEVWNSATSAIYSDLGAIVSDKIMLEAMYFFTNSTNLAEAALYVLQADTVLFGGQHSTTICSRFQQRNILDINCKPTDLFTAQPSQAPYQLHHSLAWSQGSSAAWITFANPQSGTATLYNSLGQRIWTEALLATKSLTIDNRPLPAGVYFLVVDGNQQPLRIPLLKH